MGQRKIDSLLESCINSIVSVLLYLTVLGVVSLIVDDLYAAVPIAFVVSIGKNYVVRRVASRRENV